MAKEMPATIAMRLSLSERLLLFCVMSGLDWAGAGITRTTVTAATVKGLVERNAAARLGLTDEGRAVLSAITGRAIMEL